MSGTVQCTPEPATMTIPVTAPKFLQQLPSSSTFSFKAPFPATMETSASSSSTSSPHLKQRRVSLALPSNSPRVVPAWSFRDDTVLQSHAPESSTMMPEKRGKMRRIDNEADDEDDLASKKQRKKWSTEETQMLVDGCNKHGVGNWKAILNDPTLCFDNRSPVDLKDRFRTYFPDAYKQHYPNARTHLSSKVRSTLPDGSSLFEKTRSKKRRPFTEEEDRALKAGYEKHGTVWATIVKHPIFQEQNRRSTDLRDRFRNAYPELYQAAGYKPRTALKKRTVGTPARAATDDQLTMSSGPVRRRRRHTSQGILRGGTKSVPQSATPSEDEYSSGEEDNIVPAPRQARTSVLLQTTSQVKRSQSMLAPTTVMPQDDEGMNTNSFSGFRHMSDIPPNSSQSDIDARSQTWSSGLDTPTHSSHNAWSTVAGSPTSSHLSADYLSSPFQQRDSFGGAGTIGKSAWGGDWFAENPRLDPTSSMSPFLGSGLSPSSPFSFSSLNHGVMDRYDLLPTSMPSDFHSEAGIGDSHSTFSDEFLPPSGGFRGFTHHSDYAGDLIFGARQPQQGFYGSNDSGFGLGLSGMTSSSGVHPMQLHSNSLPGIDEIDVSANALNEQVATLPSAMEDVSISTDSSLKGESDLESSDFGRFNLEDLVNIPPEMNTTPPATPVTSPRHLRARSTTINRFSSVSSHSRSISVPPTDARIADSARPPEFSTSRSIPFGSRPPTLNSQEMPPPSSFPVHHFVNQAATNTSISQAQFNAELYNLPFLDLHYYSNLAMNPGILSDTANGVNPQELYRQGQALDLARTPVTNVPPGSFFGSPYSQSPGPMRRVSSSGAGGGINPADIVSQQGFIMKSSSPTVASSRSSYVHHQRGQSAVRPQDLILRNDNNKRKRASWDGAHP